MNILHLGRLICAGLLALGLWAMAPAEPAPSSSERSARSTADQHDAHAAGDSAPRTPVAALSVGQRTARD